MFKNRKNDLKGKKYLLRMLQPLKLYFNNRVKAHGYLLVCLHANIAHPPTNQKQVMYRLHNYL